MNNFEYVISSDPTKLDIERIKSLMRETYWANERTEETLLKSMENSICYGVYKDNTMIGFGRVVTDYATVFWVCDIIIDRSHRGKGIGKQLMEYIMADGQLEGLLGILATKDAHGLYEQYGFIKEPFKFMMKKRTRK